MNNESPYIITYTNHFIFNGRTLSFRKKFLFDITEMPTLVKYNDSGFWYINRVQLTKQKAKELVRMKPIEIDVTNLQWYQQIQLDECFNL